MRSRFKRFFVNLTDQITSIEDSGLTIILHLTILLGIINGCLESIVVQRRRVRNGTMIRHRNEIRLRGGLVHEAQYKSK